MDKAAGATKQAQAPKTKAGLLNAMYVTASKMKKGELQAAYDKMMGGKVDESVAESIDTTSELDALVESEATLSEEFKEKTAVIFEAAVRSKLSEEVDRLEEQYKEELSEEVSAVKS